MLTSLATTAHLRATVLQSFDIPTDVDRLPIRPLHLTTELCDWIDGPLYEDKRKIGGRTLYEHLEQYFIEFRCDDVLHATLRRMMPNKKGVWKMHPPGLRVYGWVPAPHQFIAVCAALETDTHSDKTLNDKRREEVRDFIKKHHVTEIVYGDFLHAFPKTP
ncbi:MAG: hypothetical protein J0J01_08765 [Reyranella sp.]|uniref:hypothetical protein n=1 Tax=Reyranella sp. TaxID=1929291 RepID=UPI001AD28208|nr:hypothetical protein [Reyranella sp.]MBN9086985.1 hypothetical protein [Reyranella sp.]